MEKVAVVVLALLVSLMWLHVTVSIPTVERNAINVEVVYGTP